MTLRRLAVVVLALVLAACASRQPAPVETRPAVASRPAAPAPQASVPPKPAAPAERPEFYTVRPGDTAFGIATTNGIDVRQLATMNNLAEPLRLQPGQVLRVRPAQVAAPAPGPADGVQIGQVASSGAIEARPLESLPPPKPLPDTPRAPGAAGAEPPRAGPADVPKPPAGRAVVTEPRAFKLPFSDENLAQIQRSEGVAIARVDVKPAAEAPKPPAAKPEAPKPEPAKPEAVKPEAAKPEAAKPEPPKPEAAKPEPPKPAARADADDRDRVEWIWPAAGRIVERFEGNNKGVDIAGAIGESVLAAAPGRVVYAGSGLRGYGQLVIIKHNETYLSAYAHNSKILVKEGQNVSRGQKIAELGQSDADRPKLHFEIRRAGKPVDPLGYLPDR